MGNTPNVRFKGFTEDWEQRKVTDLGEIYIGLVTTMTEHYTDSGHLLIRNSDIKDGYFEFGENPIYIYHKELEKLVDEDSAIITLFYGEDVTEEDANNLRDELEEKFEDLDIELYYGGQPLYYYLISVE